MKTWTAGGKYIYLLCFWNAFFHSRGPFCSVKKLDTHASGHVHQNLKFNFVFIDRKAISCALCREKYEITQPLLS